MSLDQYKVTAQGDKSMIDQFYNQNKTSMQKLMDQYGYTYDKARKNLALGDNGLSNYQLHQLGGGTSMEQQAADAAAGNKTTSTNAPLTWNEQVQSGMLGNTSNLNKAGSDQTTGNILNPTDMRNIQDAREVGSWDASGNLVAPNWQPSDYTPSPLLSSPVTIPVSSNGSGNGQQPSPSTTENSTTTSSNTATQERSNPQTSAYSVDHLNSLLASDSPYMKLAEQKALEQANSRGLLNSSIAVGSAQRAAIEAAAPFALQDSQFRQNAELNYQQLQANKELNQQQSDLTIGRGAYDTVANTQGKYLSAIEEITRQATISINEIETAANISPEDKATMIQNTIDRRDADLAWTRQLYSNMPTWDLSWINLTEMPDAPGVV